MSEPLTKEKMVVKIITPRNEVVNIIQPCNVKLYEECAIVSALSGMKEDTNDFYRTIGKPKVWAQSNDELCDLCEEHAKKFVDKWFPFLSDKRQTVEIELHRTMTSPVTKETTSLSGDAMAHEEMGVRKE